LMILEEEELKTLKHLNYESKVIKKIYTFSTRNYVSNNLAFKFYKS
jgi:hypothetical protein